MSSSIFSLKLRDASFKGVPFHVASISKSFLRRKVVHEYPQRDDHYVEDLGKGVTSYDVTAFLVGDNCVEKAKRLEKVLLSLGPGTFVNPWEGNLNVTVLDASSVTYTNEVLRYCSLRIKFIDAGRLVNPTASANNVSMARSFSDALGLSAVSNFVESFKNSKFFQLYQSALNGSILERLNIITNSEIAQIFDISDEILEFGANAAYLLGAGPQKFADTLLESFGLARYTTTKTRWSGVVNQLTNIVRSDAFNSATAAKINEPAVVSDMEDDSISNQAAVEVLMRNALLSQAIGAATMIGTSVDTEAEAENGGVESYSSDSGEFNLGDFATSVPIEEVLETRDNMLSVIDTELQNPLISDEMFVDLLNARCAVFTLLTEKTEGLSRLIEVKLPANAPALVIASDYYDNALREAEIVKRNKIFHAGFCPNDLKLLSK